jgi:hypothetical protein
MDGDRRRGVDDVDFSLRPFWVSEPSDGELEGFLRQDAALRLCMVVQELANHEAADDPAERLIVPVSLGVRQLSSAPRIAVRYRDPKRDDVGAEDRLGVKDRPPDLASGIK